MTEEDIQEIKQTVKDTHEQVVHVKREQQHTNQGIVDFIKMYDGERADNLKFQKAIIDTQAQEIAEANQRSKRAFWISIASVFSTLAHGTFGKYIAKLWDWLIT